MGAAEVFWRIRRLLWQIYARLQHKRWELLYERNSVHLSKMLEVIDSVQFYGLSDVGPKDFPQSWADSTIASAERLLQHRYSYLALGEIELGEEINWNREYKRGIDTPLLFGPWMDYRDTASFGDFKYFWELPRFQHLIILAKAYYLTDEEKYAEEVIKQIKSFVKQSPYLLGVNWVVPMEASIRLVSISWITVFLKEYLTKNAGLCALIEQIVKSHVDYVARNYAAYSSANNHLIAEAAGVFIASLCFGRLKKMRTHRRKAYDILCREITLQHYADGANKEQAIHYQLFAFEFLLLAGLLGRANGVDFPAQYWEMLEKNAGFIAAIANDDCSLPEIGDSDDGKALVLSETDRNIVQSILATSAVLFERGDFKAKARNFDEVSFWLLGNKGRDQFDALSAESVAARNAFEQSGYYILGGSNSTKAKVIFDCGPLGLEPIAAHGHADSLSFILSAYGRAYFIDPGTYTYIANNPFRNYFRSTVAHNTVVVDGQSQSQIAGPFLWSHKANSFLEEYVNDASHDRVVGWHDGYQRLQDPVIHRRSIEFNKRSEIVEINDVLEAGSSHEIAIYFHLAPKCEVDKLEKNRWLITNDSKTVELVTDNKLNCKVIKGSEEPLAGWASSAYDHKVQINTLVCDGSFDGNQSFTTHIRLCVD